MLALKSREKWPGVDGGAGRELLVAEVTDASEQIVKVVLAVDPALDGEALQLVFDGSKGARIEKLAQIVLAEELA